MKRMYFLLVVALALVKFPASAQTYRDDYQNFLVTAGYQRLIHPDATYNVFTFHAEVVYSFVGSRLGLTAGPDYFSFSPFGIIMAVPSMLMTAADHLESADDPFFRLTVMIAMVSAMQVHIPLADEFEITAGWDALKFTKLKNYSDVFYITGSLNAGFSVYFSDNVFVNAYYEFNHTHNPFIDMLNWVDFGIGHQPSVLKGHSFGIRLGVQL